MNVDKSLGVTCSIKIIEKICANYPQDLGNAINYLYEIFKRSQGIGAITDITQKHIIFRIYVGSRTPKSAALYAYGMDWETILIQRQYLLADIEALELYDAVVTNTRHWGKAAEIALEFLEATVE